MRLHQWLLVIAVGITVGTPLAAQSLHVDVDAVKVLARQWNDCHTPAAVDKLAQLYAEDVRFYGATLSRARCVSLKKAELKDVGNFSQTVGRNVALSGYANEVVRCDFEKTITRDGVTSDHQAYLIVKWVGDRYVIVEESDQMTDRIFENSPALGAEVSIRDVAFFTPPSDDGSRSDSRMFLSLLLLSAVGLTALLVASGKYRKRFRRDRWSGNRIYQGESYFEKGLAFEKFIVKQFALQRNAFTLPDWRSDKFHEGIYAQSIRDPDLVYECSHGGYTRKFSVECKFRSKGIKGVVTLMDENKYKIYQSYHRNMMPFYIALGLGGDPANPAKLFLIPFDCVKLDMSFTELGRFVKTGKFFYDPEGDKLI